jgi:hypothetical protein
MTSFIPHRNIRLSHEMRRVYYAVIPKGLTVSDILIPSLWQQVAPDLRVSDLIEVVAEDGSFDGLLRVTERGMHATGVRVIYMAKYGTEETKSPDADAFAASTISWGGPVQKFRIVMADGTVAHSNFATKELAEAKRLELATA